MITTNIKRCTAFLAFLLCATSAKPITNFYLKTVVNNSSKDVRIGDFLFSPQNSYENLDQLLPHPSTPTYAVVTCFVEDTDQAIKICFSTSLSQSFMRLNVQKKSRSINWNQSKTHSDNQNNAPNRYYTITFSDDRQNNGKVTVNVMRDEERAHS
jgi:hypothetical protein